MSDTKARLSASVDAELIEAGQRAVQAGRASSLSAWVNAALTRQIEHEGRLDALAEFIREYEAEFGAFTEDELAEMRRKDKANAVVIRGNPNKPKKSRASA